MNETKTRSRLRIPLYAAGAVLALVCIVLLVTLVLPTRVVSVEPTPTPTPTPVPTAAPAPTPEPTPVRELTEEETAVLRERESIYYSFDPSLFVTDERGRITYTGEGCTCLNGIDVSEFQYDVNWQKVAADGVDFAIIRCGYRGYTSGSLKEDPYFRQNMKNAIAAGLPVGSYFFSQATSVREAREEAAFVIGLLKDYDITMPVAYDMEILSKEYRTYNMTRRTLYRCARAFCDAIREAGYTPMIYMTQFLGYQKYTLRELTDYDFWFAEYYVDYPTFVYDMAIWQYSDTGSVSGINGAVDLDVMMVRDRKE